MAERFLREARSEPGGNLGKVVEGERRSPRPAEREPRVAKRHHAKRSGQTPRVTISAKRKYVTVFSGESTKPDTPTVNQTLGAGARTSRSRREDFDRPRMVLPGAVRKK